jgi:hypothetical protein
MNPSILYGTHVACIESGGSNLKTEFSIPCSVDDKNLDASSTLMRSVIDTRCKNVLIPYSSHNFTRSRQLHITDSNTHTMRAKISRGLRSLPPQTDISTTEEYDRLIKETADIEQWWSNSHRWGYTKRPFTGNLQTILAWFAADPLVLLTFLPQPATLLAFAHLQKPAEVSSGRRRRCMPPSLQISSTSSSVTSRELEVTVIPLVRLMLFR